MHVAVRIAPADCRVHACSPSTRPERVAEGRRLHSTISKLLVTSLCLRSTHLFLEQVRSRFATSAACCDSLSNRHFRSASVLTCWIRLNKR